MSQQDMASAFAVLLTMQSERSMPRLLGKKKKKKF